MAESNGQSVIAVTMGDPAGIGAEVIVKALANRALRNMARWVIFGSNECLAYAADLEGIDPYWWRLPRTNAGQGWPKYHEVVVVDYPEYSDASVINLSEPGPTQRGGEASLAFLADAIRSVTAPAGQPDHCDALVTGPISKTSWQLAGLKRFPGHTELLADRTGAKRYAMMFVSRPLKVALATIHLPLMAVRDVLTLGRVLEPIELGHQACREYFGIERPRIAVCGLNPHASEGGLFGDDEYRVIEPAVKRARDLGIMASGPFPADTIFNAAVEGRYDLVVAMYHDQGLIPVKLLARDEAVNLTLGLPIVRTSPDHGTAFDIAGENEANPGSMTAALKLAAEIASRRTAGTGSGGR